MSGNACIKLADPALIYLKPLDKYMKKKQLRHCFDLCVYALPFYFGWKEDDFERKVREIQRSNEVQGFVSFTQVGNFEYWINKIENYEEFQFVFVCSYKNFKKCVMFFPFHIFSNEHIEKVISIKPISKYIFDENLDSYAFPLDGTFKIFQVFLADNFSSFPKETRIQIPGLIRLTHLLVKSELKNRYVFDMRNLTSVLKYEQQKDYGKFLFENYLCFLSYYENRGMYLYGHLCNNIKDGEHRVEKKSTT